MCTYGAAFHHTSCLQPSPRHRASASLESPWHQLCISSASPLHHAGIPATADDCIISLAAGNVLRAEREQLLWDTVNSLCSCPLLSPALPRPFPCPLVLCQGGCRAEEASHGFVWQVCNERSVMTLHIHQMVVFSLDPSVMLL